MTLEEAIIHAEEVAENQQEDAEKWEYTLKVYRDTKHYDSMSIHSCEKAMERCKACAEEHHQLAEWLTELEKYRTLKRIVADWKSAIRCSNVDYYTGYMSALSVVEGMIANMETNNEES